PLKLGAHQSAGLARSLTGRHRSSARTICSRLSATRSLASGLHRLTSGLRCGTSGLGGGFSPPLQLLSATESGSDTPRLIRGLTRLAGGELHRTDLLRLPVVNVLQQVEEIHLVLIWHIHPPIVRGPVALDGELCRARRHGLTDKAPGLDASDPWLPRHRESTARPQVESPQ